VERRFFGKYRGLVVDIDDTEKLGRIRARVPSVLGPDVVTGWATPCVPFGGAAGIGTLFVPPVGAGVWLEFEEGDLEFPIWVGTYWSRPDSTPETPAPMGQNGKPGGAPQSSPTRKIMRTARGNSLEFEDKEGEESVTIVDGGHQHVIRLDKDGITLQHGKGVTVTITDGAVKIGAGADESLVLGDSFSKAVKNFVQDLNTHTHTGNLGAPTSPPAVPLSLSVDLSGHHKVAK
jgi:uncharacterized protein involved in type VI secretion and phage assembly